MNPLSFIFGNKMLIVGIIALIAFASLSGYILILRSNVAELIAEKNVVTAKLEVSNASITALQNAITEQNAAVEKLKLAAEARAKANEEELKKALQAAKTYRDKADQLIKTPRPQGVEVCTAADALINQEIQNGKK